MNKIRQVAPEISGIRADHVARYQFACEQIQQLNITGKILDVGCGVGYGTNMLSTQCDHETMGIDISRETIEYAVEHYANESTMFLWADMANMRGFHFEVLTMFEAIEHSAHAPAFLSHAAIHSKYLFGSVPNENVVPFVPGKVRPVVAGRPEQLLDGV